VRNVWIQILHVSGAKIYALFVSVIGLSITARYLGPEGRGIVAAAQSWVVTFATLGSISLAQIVLFVASGKNHKEWLAKTLGVLLFTTFFMTAIGLIVVCTTYIITAGSAFNNLSLPILIIAFLGLPFLIFNDYGNSVLMAVDRLRIMNRIQIVSATLNVILIYFVIIKFNFGVVGALVITVCVQLVNSFLVFNDIFRLEKKIEIHWPSIKTMLVSGLKLHLNAIGSFLFTTINVLVVNHFRSPSETGYYQLSAQLIGIAQIMPISVSNVVYTIISKKGPDDAWPENRKLLRQSLLVIAGLAIVGYFVSPIAITVVAGKSFYPSVSLFRIMLLSLFGMTFSAVMAGQWIGRGLFLQASLITFLVGLINTICIFVFIPKYGITAAAWTTVLVYGISVICNGGMAIWVEKKYRIYKNRT
jgi:O-antigen/teichoic acid export membrane protein